MAKYVVVHGAWHSGDMFDELGRALRGLGHEVYLPTLAGNRPGDLKTTGLDMAIESLVEFFEAEGLDDVVLVGHSYGGIVITAAADRLPAGSIRRLVYWSAYVPNDGESLADMSPAYVGESMRSNRRPDGGLPMSYEYWRDVLMNDADEATARRYFARLNAQPHQVMIDKVKLSTNPAEMPIKKSYLHCQEDMCFPAGAGGWHPKFSERLGMHRFVSMPGGHEVGLTNPELSAEMIVKAGRD